MKTYRGGWIKKHKGCGGQVIFQENTDKDAWWDWDFICLKCDDKPSEEDVEFEERKK